SPRPSSPRSSPRRSRRRIRPTRPRSRSAPSSLTPTSSGELLTRPLAVAVTGGIGAGKSEALEAFRRHGAATVSSDEIVHELLHSDTVREAVVARLGNGVVGPDGRLDRGAIATVVFNDPEALAWLEGLLHPLVSLEYLRWRDELAHSDDPPRVVVTEVPLLYES